MVEALVLTVAGWGAGAAWWAAPGLKEDLKYWVESWKGVSA